jgi:hypothetical protein
LKILKVEQRYDYLVGKKMVLIIIYDIQFTGIKKAATGPTQTADLLLILGTHFVRGSARYACGGADYVGGSRVIQEL